MFSWHLILPLTSVDVRVCSAPVLHFSDDIIIQESCYLAVTAINKYKSSSLPSQEITTVT